MVGWGGGPCDYCVSPSPFDLEFGTSDLGLTIFFLTGRKILSVIHPWTETGTMVSMGHNQIVLTYIAHRLPACTKNFHNETVLHTAHTRH